MNENGYDVAGVTTAARRGGASPRHSRTGASQQSYFSSSKAEQQTTTTASTADRPSSSSNGSVVTGGNVLAGLTVAGLAASLLTTVFGLFHVDTFLSAYQLPLTTYSVGNVVYGVINTANDVAGAWVVDQVAASANRRQDLVGLTGCIFAVSFLTPFFRPWTAPTSNSTFWDGLHFVLSLSLYDSMYSFAMILYGSIVSDENEMSQAQRVRFLAICKVVNLLANFGIARVGLAVFSVENLTSFRIFLVALVLVSCALSVVAQGLIHGDDCSFSSLTKLVSTKPKKTETPKSSTASSPTSTTRKLEWRRVLRDFVRHKNFCAWIGMEMLLESQNTFNSFFRKTFVDRLVLVDGGLLDKETCDWMLSAMRPITAIVSICIFIPIRKFGYPKIYRLLFVFNLVVSFLLLCVADSESTTLIVAFLFVYPVLTASVQSAGFALAMADMVMDMKHLHVVMDGRYDEPSLAGMFMGMNALFCKPMEGFLPVVAAQALRSEARSKQNLFYVLTLPPLIYSCLQLLSWSRYDLEPKRVEQKRKELQKLLSTRSEEDIDDDYNVV